MTQILECFCKKEKCFMLLKLTLENEIGNADGEFGKHLNYSDWS